MHIIILINTTSSANINHKLIYKNDLRNTPSNILSYSLKHEAKSAENAS